MGHDLTPTIIVEDLPTNVARTPQLKKKATFRVDSGDPISVQGVNHEDAVNNLLVVLASLGWPIDKHAYHIVER